MYIPFVLSCILTIMMYYMVSSLSMNPNMMNMIGGDVMQQILSLGIYVITVFAVIFLFYTNSFLIKRRKREFGLFNILGMEKKHLSIVIALESMIVFLVSMVLGIGIGILLDKAFYLLIAKMLNASIALGFYISYQSIVNSIILFLIIFVLMYLFSLIQINLSNPIELLHGDQHGEKEPKTKWLLALIGLICLGTGYYMSVSIQDPVTAFAFFMVAVILVVIGTYMLFTAGSIVLLKLLRKNKRYYYKTNHFISVSNMIYRMKQNAVGLGNICILSTMVLVMLSTTISLWVGMNDIIETRFPRDITVSINSVDSNQALYTIDDMNYAIEQAGIQTEDELVYRTLSVSAFNQGNTYTFGNENIAETLKNILEFRGKEAKITVGRELTKKFEETKTDSVENVIEYYTKNTLKGEIVCLLYADENFDDEDFHILEKAKLLKKLKYSDKDISQILSALYGFNKNKVYKLVLTLQN